MRRWSVPKTWAGRPAFLLAGGPSLKGFDAERLGPYGHVLAINDSYLLAPWADAVFWADKTWFGWNWQELRALDGPLLVSWSAPHVASDLDVHVLDHREDLPLSRDPRALAGVCSGSGAINLAWLLGADPIHLLGYDMRDSGNWHDRHRRYGQEGRYENRFIPAIGRMADELHKEGARVFNLTPGSALTCFPSMSIEEALA